MYCKIQVLKWGRYIARYASRYIIKTGIKKQTTEANTLYTIYLYKWSTSYRIAWDHVSDTKFFWILKYLHYIEHSKYKNTKSEHQVSDFGAFWVLDFPIWDAQPVTVKTQK